MQDAQLSEKLRLTLDLTLEKAVTKAHQSEAIKQQQAVVQALGKIPQNVDALYGRVADRSSSGNESLTIGTGSSITGTGSSMCTQCGKGHSVRQPCPARNAICHKCHKRGHFQVVYQSRLVNTFDIQQEEAFLGTAEHSNGSTGKWEETLLVNGTPIEFQIDTGADVNVISESMFKRLQGVNLQPAVIPLSGAGQQSLSVCGKFTGTLTHKVSVIKEEIFVVEKLQKALLGKPAIEALNLVARVNAIKKGEDIPNKYPALFTGLGTLEGEYHIQLKEDATPFALIAP